MSSKIIFRTSNYQDLRKAHAVFLEALNSSEMKHGIEPFSTTYPVQSKLWEHLQATSRGRFWVAENAGKIIGVACAVVRNQRWWLAELFISPDFQANHVGEKLLDAVMSPKESYTELATCAPSYNPTAVAIYSKAGMIPLMPVMAFSGSFAREDNNKDIKDLKEEKINHINGEIQEFDTQIWGANRFEDIHFWLHDKAYSGYSVYLKNELIGYYFISRYGAIGPMSTTDPQSIALMLSLGSRRLKTIGAREINLWIPGHNIIGIKWCLQRGYKLTSVSILHSSQPRFGKMDRYIASGPDLF